MKKKFGLLPPPEDNKAYVLGGGNLPNEILQPNREWKEFLPDPELQKKRGIETYDCTGFGFLEAVETFLFRKYGLVINFSDRWLGIVAGTGQKQGNDPHTVCEAIRKHGLIPEEMLPFSDDLGNYEEYYSFKGANEQACREAGKKWLEEWEFLHEWIYRPTQPDDEKINNLKVSLQYAPAPVSVYAWATDERGVYFGLSQQNHLTLMESFPEPTIWKARDSYEPHEKQVEQVPLYAKRIYLEKREVVKKRSIWQLILSFFGLEHPEEMKKIEPILNPDYVEPEPPKKNNITVMAEAIRDFEGYAGPGERDRTGKLWPNGTASWRRRNPGNIKGINGEFLIFKTYEKGFAYLEDYLKRACTGKHNAYKPTYTIYQFCQTYAPDPEPIPTNYAKFISNRLGFLPSTKLKDLV